jgi:hypothetical protein
LPTCFDYFTLLLFMRRYSSITFLLVGLLYGSAFVAGAQTYDLSWYTIAGGGGSSSGTNASNVIYSVSGTIGQSDAGTMSGSNFTLTGGFWGIIAAVQTVGSPFLTIKAATPGHVTLSWVSAAAFRPQQNPALATTNWTVLNTNTFPIVINGTTNSVTLPVSGNQFFRLVNP